MTDTERREPTSPDVFRHTATAQANRRRKAEALVAAAVWLGCTDLEDLQDPDQRHAILTHAHQVDPTIPARASEETWALTRQIRTETRVHRLPPGEDPADVVACGCLMQPVTRVLYASVIYLGEDMAGGWLCPHEDYRLPAPQITPDPVVSALNGAGWDDGSGGGWGDGWDDGSEPDWPALAAVLTAGATGERPEWS